MQPEKNVLPTSVTKPDPHSQNEIALNNQTEHASKRRKLGDCAQTVTLLLGSEGVKKVYEKSLLEKCGDFFKQALSGGMREASTLERLGGVEMDLRYLEPEIFSNIVTFSENGKFDDAPDLLIDTLTMADQLSNRPLCKKLLHDFSRQLTPRNWAQYIEIPLYIVQEKLLDYIAHNAFNLLNLKKTQLYKSLSGLQVESILKLEKINAPEKQLFDFLIDWAHSNKDEQTTLKALLSKPLPSKSRLIDLIKLNLISLESIWRKVDTFGLYTTEQLAKASRECTQKERSRMENQLQIDKQYESLGCFDTNNFLFRCRGEYGGNWLIKDMDRLFADIEAGETVAKSNLYHFGQEDHALEYDEEFSAIITPWFRLSENQLVEVGLGVVQRESNNPSAYQVSFKAHFHLINQRDIFQSSQTQDFSFDEVLRYPNNDEPELFHPLIPFSDIRDENNGWLWDDKLMMSIHIEDFSVEY